MKKAIVSLSIGLGLVGLVNAGEAVGEAKTTATMQATCSITVAPVGFGVVSTPLMIQSAQSEMSVKCSNASAYSINLAYGGIYGQVGTDSGYRVAYSTSDMSSNNYRLSSSSGIHVGYMECGYSSGRIGQVWFGNTQGANLYGYINPGWQYDTKKTACITNNTQTGTYPVGWVGAYNDSGAQSIGGSAYNYGIMQGSFKGDKLAYSIAVPGESNKVWNGSINSYKGSGNGDFQTIPVVAKIVPDKSGSPYPAPDMYLDTITAVINY